MNTFHNALTDSFIKAFDREALNMRLTLNVAIEARKAAA